MVEPLGRVRLSEANVSDHEVRAIVRALSPLTEDDFVWMLTNGATRAAALRLLELDSDPLCGLLLLRLGEPIAIARLRDISRLTVHGERGEIARAVRECFANLLGDPTTRDVAKDSLMAGLDLAYRGPGSGTASALLLFDAGEQRSEHVIDALVHGLGEYGLGSKANAALLSLLREVPMRRRVLRAVYRGLDCREHWGEPGACALLLAEVGEPLTDLLAQALVTALRQGCAAEVLTVLRSLLRDDATKDTSLSALRAGLSKEPICALALTESGEPFEPTFVEPLAGLIGGWDEGLGRRALHVVRSWLTDAKVRDAVLEILASSLKPEGYPRSSGAALALLDGGIPPTRRHLDALAVRDLDVLAVRVGFAYTLRPSAVATFRSLLAADSTRQLALESLRGMQGNPVAAELLFRAGDSVTDELAASLMAGDMQTLSEFVRDAPPRRRHVRRILESDRAFAYEAGGPVVLTLLSSGEPPDERLVEQLLHSLRSPSWDARVKLTRLLLDPHTKHEAAKVVRPGKWGAGSWRAVECLLILNAVGNGIEESLEDLIEAADRRETSQLLKGLLADDATRPEVESALLARLASSEARATGDLHLRGTIARLLVDNGAPLGVTLGTTLINVLGEEDTWLSDDLAKGTFKVLLGDQRRRTEAEELLRRALDDPRPKVRSRAAVLLVRHGDAPNERLIKALTEVPDGCRDALVRLLSDGDFREETVRSLRLSLLRRPSSAIAELLIETGEPVTDPIVRGLLSYPDTRAVKRVAQLLNDKSETASIVANLRLLLSDRNRAVAVASASVLLESGEDSGVEVLRCLQGECDRPDVTAAFRRALEDLSTRADALEILRLGLSEQGVARPHRTPAEQTNARFRCATLLLESGEPLDRPILAALMLGLGPAGKYTEARPLLARLASQPATRELTIEGLYSLLDQFSEQVKAALVLVSLGVVDDPRVLRGLRRGLDAFWGSEPREIFLQLLNDARTERAARAVLIDGLSDRGPSWEATVSALVLVHSREPLSAEIVWALLKHLGRRNDITREAAETFIGIASGGQASMGGVGLLPTLLAGLNGEKRHLAHYGLELLLSDGRTQEKVRAVLVDGLQHSDPAIRSACQMLLQGMNL